MATKNLNIRVDEELKAKADRLFNELGMPMSTAITMFLKCAVRSGGFPCDLNLDPFYSESNMRAIDESIEQINQGKVVVKTMEELEAMANE